MNELIKLNPTEQFLANQNISMTLKDIADRYGKRHNDLKATFNLAISKLSEENIGYVQVVPKKISIETGKGKIEEINTFSLDLRTMLWLMTKFDENMRMNVINYAFEKLEKDKDLAVIEAKKPKIYSDGRMSVRRCIYEAWDDNDVNVPNESDIWNSLIWKGFAVTKAKVTTTRVIPESIEGFIGSMKNRGFATYTPKVIRQVWSEFEDAKKPTVSEYERLKEEFSQISKYYEEKLLEAKDK
jgi:hypothetical protein